MASVKVELTRPIELHGKRLAEIELREPTGGLYVKHGEPRVLVFNASGSGYWVPQQEAIKAYLEALIVHDLGGDLVNLMSLEDAMATQEALYSFFRTRQRELPREERRPRLRPRRPEFRRRASDDLERHRRGFQSRHCVAARTRGLAFDD